MPVYSAASQIFFGILSQRSMYRGKDSRLHSLERGRWSRD